MLIIKLLEHSPTETTILFSVVGILAALQVMIIGILFQIKGDVGNLKGNIGELKEFKRQTVDKIGEMNDEAKEFRSEVTNKINETESRFPKKIARKS